MKKPFSKGKYRKPSKKTQMKFNPNFYVERDKSISDFEQIMGKNNRGVK